MDIFSSTNLNSRIKSYQLLGERIKMQLGHPLVQVEIHDDQLYDCIAQAVEWYTKYAGTNEEYIIFRSSLYEKGAGLHLGNLLSYTAGLTATNAAAPDGVDTNTETAWDYDLESVRKVVDVFSFEQGNSSGINTLFTLEQTVANQMYYGNMMGGMGFDLVTWECLKQWLDTRQKVLAQVPYFRFNINTQRLTIIPEPGENTNYYGLIGAHVERPIKHVIHERWVYKYAMALVKVTVAHVRGKYGGTGLFGGQTVNSQDLMSQGIAERDKLEEELLNSYGEVTPPSFFVG